MQWDQVLQLLKDNPKTTWLYERMKQKQTISVKVSTPKIDPKHLDNGNSEPRVIEVDKIKPKDYQTEIGKVSVDDDLPF